MEPEYALSQIRSAVEALEHHETARRQARAWTSLRREGIEVTLGRDVIAVPFYYCTNRARAEITRRAFRHLRRVSEEVGARVIGLGSEGDVSRGIWCEIFDEVDYHEYPQAWSSREISGAGGVGLRAKFDETVRRARVHDPGRVFIGGSDDIIPMDWWRAAWKSEADLVGVKGGAQIVRYGPARAEQSALWSWDGHYSWATDVEFCGGGVLMSRELLDAWCWAPFDEPGDEIRLERRAREEGWKVEAIDGRFWAIKAPGAALNEAQKARRVGAVQATSSGVRGEWMALWRSLA